MIMPTQTVHPEPASHPQVTTGHVGVLLVNLGTPDGCDTKSVRRYLAEFLSDRRVIELTPWLWQPILHGIILRTRPPKSAAAYAKIWMQESDESPLRHYTRSQATKLSKQLIDDEGKLHISWAMRYGNPSIRQQLSELRQQACDRILVMPLYPQYSATTTATVNDRVFDVLKDLRWQPALRTVPPYYGDPAYIAAIGKSINRYLSNCTDKPDVILASYHGLPQEYFDKGDPYYCHCAKTTRLLREYLQRDDDFLPMSFQSRFGPKKWLQPYTVDVLERLAIQQKKVAVIMPGFAADCLETLEEMNMQNREFFRQHGGEHYDFIPCLNDTADSIEMLASLIRNELKGWY